MNTRSTAPTPKYLPASSTCRTVTFACAAARTAWQPPPAFPACLPPAMWPTIFTARRSPRRALAAWPPLTRKTGWTICRPRPVKVQSRPFSSLEQPVWDGLCATPGPFVDWRFLASAAEAGCTGPAAGWHPLALIENDADGQPAAGAPARSEEHTSELQSRGHLVCRLLLEKKKKKHHQHPQ